MSDDKDAINKINDLAEKARLCNGDSPCHTVAQPPEPEPEPEPELEPEAETRAKKEKETRAVALPTDVSPAIFADWQALRRAKKAPITATAISGIRREADKAGISLESALAMSCERGWTGFKADWVHDRGGGPLGGSKQAALEARNKAVLDQFRGAA